MVNLLLTLLPLLLFSFQIKAYYIADTNTRLPVEQAITAPKKTGTYIYTQILHFQVICQTNQSSTTFRVYIYYSLSVSFSIPESLDTLFSIEKLGICQFCTRSQISLTFRTLVLLEMMQV